MKKNLSVFTISLFLSWITVCKGALSFTGFYSQDFNSLSSTESTGNTWTDNSTIEGWYANKTGYNVDHGNNPTTTVLHDYGANASSDRALGSFASGTSGTIFYGVAFQNNTGGLITDLLVTYTGEQWRNGNNPNVLTFEYLVGDPTGNTISAGTWTSVSSLSFTGPQSAASGLSALDGNAAENSTPISFTITGLNIVDHSDFWFRWGDADTTGTDAGLAIDNFSLTAVPEPSEWAAICACGLLGLCGLRVWQRRSIASAIA